ncbi:MAG: hypothetical protein AVDCRST_MAG93-848 [uncultured Chloroflexia bacterium]|uniref:Uncharacterized protein n=1 Tax=uncultured Chloroflexia bacterium TaxID=1672391 RepID=A0A6J4HS01_9CHLR|nr:MAG: hypothetical protein AVDCRST_MAG93-848 [uncultured Chloroflexia bacterium]
MFSLRSLISSESAGLPAAPREVQGLALDAEPAGLTARISKPDPRSSPPPPQGRLDGAP